MSTCHDMMPWHDVMTCQDMMTCLDLMTWHDMMKWHDMMPGQGEAELRALLENIPKPTLDAGRGEAEAGRGRAG